jgi:hypothetical protein
MSATFSQIKPDEARLMEFRIMGLRGRTDEARRGKPRHTQPTSRRLTGWCVSTATQALAAATEVADPESAESQQTSVTSRIEPDAALVYLYLWTTRRLRTIDHAARVAHAVPLDVALWIPRTAGSARRAA